MVGLFWFRVLGFEGGFSGLRVIYFRDFRGLELSVVGFRGGL